VAIEVGWRNDVDLRTSDMGDWNDLLDVKSETPEETKVIAFDLASVACRSHLARCLILEGFV
jgi:hypothetical protein